tara:strand:- start:69 stop:542 length:474 start_codon:yes stop_codon:yes gene_type:complete|mmetsp:Transcript_9598/g.22828  ORF Transcript_9598/g.22828 Transcript_9598/m.22828 type:complete len:158 (+) Transcript_9598:97-570(+)
MIREVHNMLEALRHIGPRFEAAMNIRDLDEDEGSQYSHVTVADQAATVALLRSTVGNTWAELCAGRSQRLQQQGGGRFENPSARVARVAGAGADDDTAAGAEGDREDDLGDDEDETGGPVPAPHVPAHAQEPDSARLTRDEFWDAKVVKVMRRCPLT